MTQVDFDIDKEIDKLIDTSVEKFKTKLKTLIMRSEKLVLQHYILSDRSIKSKFRSLAPKREREYCDSDSGYDSN